MRRKNSKLAERVRELEGAEALRNAELDQLDRDRDDLLAKLAGLDEEQASVFLGERDPEEVKRRKDEIESRVADVGLRIEELQALAAPLQRRLAEAREAVEQARIEATVTEHSERLSDRRIASRKFYEKPMTVTLNDLEHRRTRVDESAGRLRALLEERPWPEFKHEDEPDWPDADRVATALQAGPLQPRAQAEAARRESEAVQEAQYREIAAWVERNGRHSDLERLLPKDRGRIERLWAEEKRAEQVRREASRRAREFPSLR